jgi:hypothetical protein
MIRREMREDLELATKYGDLDIIKELREIMEMIRQVDEAGGTELTDEEIVELLQMSDVNRGCTGRCRS